MNRKSVIQVVVLLVLVLALGGVYLSTQEGGLDFLTSLLPGSESPAPPATTQTQSTATTATAPEAMPIPATPAKGQVNGVAFEPDSVAFEGGVLAFVQSKEPQAAVLIQVVGPKWEAPAGKKFKYAPAGANSPVVLANRMEQGEMKQKRYEDKYNLVLEFGAEKDKKLSGKIRLQVAGDAKTELVGSFDAEIKGFRFVDGKPDLTADSKETLQYLTLRELLKDDPDKQINVITFRDDRLLTDGNRTNSTGYIEVEYRVGQGPSEIARFQFVKNPEWKIRGTLALDQLDEAHPLSAPGAKDPAEQLLPYLAAKRLEADVKKKSPKKGIYGVALVTRQNTKTKLGVTEASYRTEPDGQPIKTAYLFRLKPNGWALDRELTAKEKANVDSGKIEKK